MCGNMGGGADGSSGGSGGANFSAQAQKISNPTTKQDFLDRAEFIAEVSENAAYNYDVSTSDWQKNRRNRTYIKMNQYNTSDGSLRTTMDMGYYDNVKSEYVKGYGKNSDVMKGNVWNIQGSQKYNESDIAEFLKNKKNNK